MQVKVSVLMTGLSRRFESVNVTDLHEIVKCPLRIVAVCRDKFSKSPPNGPIA